MKKSTEFRSFAFTIRPSEGVPEGGKLEKFVIDYVAKYKGFVAAEMEDNSRHIHGQIFFEKKKRKHDFNKKLAEFCEKTIDGWCPKQDHVMRSGTTIPYNDDWYLEYANKPDTDMLLHAMPANSAEYYPSKEEQEMVMAYAQAVDKTFHVLQELFNSDPPPTEHDFVQKDEVYEWLYRQMYIKKTIRVIEDKRKFNQRATSLFHYIRADSEAFSQF